MPASKFPENMVNSYPRKPMFLSLWKPIETAVCTGCSTQNNCRVHLTKRDIRT